MSREVAHERLVLWIAESGLMAVEEALVLVCLGEVPEPYSEEEEELEAVPEVELVP